MKKYVLFSDGKNLSDKTLAFINDLHKTEPFLLTGTFFSTLSYSFILPNAYAYNSAVVADLTKEDHHLFNEGVKKFSAFCLRHQIESRVHKLNEDWDTRDLALESRFADMVIVNGRSFFADVEKDQPNEFLKEVLHNTECPVLIVPENVSPIKKILIAYDGSRESMHALKMFGYVLPKFTKLPVEINYWVNNDNDGIPHADFIKEFAARHFTNLSLHERYFDSLKYLATWLEGNRDAIFVSGSYKRSGFSNWFKKSFVEDVLKNNKTVVFIAHN